MSRTFFAFIFLTISCSTFFYESSWAARMIEDVTLKFSEPIDIVNKVLTDLDNNIENYLGDARPGQYSSSLPTEKPLISENAAADINKAQTYLDALAPNVSISNTTSTPPNNLQELTESLVELDRKLQNMNQVLQQRRRFVLGAMVHQMQSTVRRIRQNVGRIKVQMETLDTVATQVPVLRLRGSNATAEETAAMAATSANVNANKEQVDKIVEQIHSVSKKINDIVSRLSTSLKVSTDASTLARPQLNPIVTLNSIIQSAGQTLKRPKN